MVFFEQRQPANLCLHVVQAQSMPLRHNDNRIRIRLCRWQSRNPSDPSFELWGAAIFTVTDVANMEKISCYADAVGQNCFEHLPWQLGTSSDVNALSILWQTSCGENPSNCNIVQGMEPECSQYVTFTPHCSQLPNCAANVKLTLKPLRECVGPRSSIAFENFKFNSQNKDLTESWFLMWNSRMENAWYPSGVLFNRFPIALFSMENVDGAEIEVFHGFFFVRNAKHD